VRDGPKFFEDLMAAVGSDDGREIVLELEALRRQGRLARDPSEGRYSLATPTPTLPRRRGPEGA
jgi:hypothetical protein